MSTVDLPCFLVFVCLKTVKIVEQEFNISPLNSAKSIHTYLGHFIHRMSVKLIIVWKILIFCKHRFCEKFLPYTSVKCSPRNDRGWVCYKTTISDGRTDKVNCRGSFAPNKQAYTTKKPLDIPEKKFFQSPTLPFLMKFFSPVMPFKKMLFNVTYK